MDYDPSMNGVCADFADTENSTPRKRRLPTASGVVALAFLAVTGCLTLAAGPAQAAAAPFGQSLTNGRSRNEAIQAIPFDQMDEQLRAKLWRVVSKPSIYRRLPVQTIDCDPDMYVFLVRYPEVLVNIWQLMGVTKVQIKRSSPFAFNASDGVGTVTNVELVCARPDLHVYYADGIYEGPLIHNRITGRCVVVLRSAFARQGGRIRVTTHLDAFIDLDNLGAEILAKTLHPLFGKTADHNFTETTQFVGQVSRASEANGPGVERLAAKLTNIDPAVRQTFADYAEVVYQRAILRRAAGAVSLPASNANVGSPRGESPVYVSSDASSATLEPVTPRRRTPIFRR
ncbi:MAG: hypothetical protein H8E44_27320 [Planctomycetes bacterium]|nr:hypothetical protein [Planctomycetota bacterium]MBL7041552.1 hypothetical protein [Pirellulaceae bacterium]